LARRWFKAGWDIDKTILLEIQHPTIPNNERPDTGFPSELFAGIIFAWSAHVYFRVVVFTKNFFQYTNDILLQINIWHEKQHSLTIEENVHTGKPFPTEKEVVRKELEFVRKMFGEEGFSARRNVIHATINRLRDSAAIPGNLAILWLREYFGTHHKQYTAAALPIPVTPYAKALHCSLSKIAQYWIRVYNALDDDISKLFKNNLEDLSII